MTTGALLLLPALSQRSRYQSAAGSDTLLVRRRERPLPTPELRDQMERLCEANQAVRQESGFDLQDVEEQQLEAGGDGIGTAGAVQHGSQ